MRQPPAQPSQTPDYAYMRKLLRDVFVREGFVDDGVFDWMPPPDAGTKLDRQFRSGSAIPW